MKKEQQDKVDIGAGFLSGALMSLGINIEETILIPFIGGVKGFEMIVIIFSVIATITSILFISQKRGSVHTVSIFIFSYIGGYIIFMSKNPIYISIGLVPLIISVLIARETNKTT